MRADLWIAIHGQVVQINDIDHINTQNFSSQENSVVEFCRQWLSGKETFQIRTSGSTGSPKTITLHRKQMIASAEMTGAALKLKSGMTALLCLDCRYIAGMMMVVRSMTTGMNLIVTEPVANPLQQIPSDKKIDFAAFVPYQLGAMIVSEMKAKLNTIGIIIFGGAPVSEDSIIDIQNLEANCYATFGMTETISHIALQRLNGPNAQQYFRALDGIQLSLDTRQCLVIDADYLNETVTTNDIVELKGATEFKWLGRVDNVINSGGVKVIPETVERAIALWMMKKQLTSRFFVTGIPHDQLGTQVILMIEGAFDEGLIESLTDHLKASVTKYELPRQVLTSASFKETPTGKVDRNATIKDALPRPGL